MRVIALILFCMCLLVCVARPKNDDAFWKTVSGGVETLIALNVVDDDGVAVRGAKVRMVFSRSEAYDVRDGVTDEDGKCIVDNKTCGNSIEVLLSKDGYYDSHLKLCYIQIGKVHDVKGGKWQPYPMEKVVVLKKIRKPVALKRIDRYFEFLATNSWFGFDMCACDFVAPHGRGETADFECRVEWDGLPPTKSKFCKMALRMTGALAGGYYEGCANESECPFSYAAKANGDMIGEICVINRNGDPHKTKVPFREQSEFVTRTRCVVDRQGRLQSANYGSIRGLRVSPNWDGNPTLGIQAVFNPVPNDTNLEDEYVAKKSIANKRKASECVKR